MKRILIFALVSVLMLAGCTKTAKEPEVWENTYIETASRLNSESEFNLGFGFYDMDNDGTPELFAQETAKTYGVYTAVGEETVKIGVIFLEPYVTFEGNSVFTYGGVGTGACGGFIYTLENGGLKERALFDAAYFDEQWKYFFDSENVKVKLEAGESISEEEYYRMLEKYEVRAIDFYSLEELSTGEKSLKEFVTVK